MDSEFEVALKKERRTIAQSLPKEQNISVQEGVGQFRKNNEKLSEYFDPGKSSHTIVLKNSLIRA